MDPWTGVLWGVVSGIGWGILGYGREKQKEDPKKPISFSWKYFIKTVVIGAIVGAYAGYTGMPIETVVVTPVIDKVINIVSGLFK